MLSCFSPSHRSAAARSIFVPAAVLVFLLSLTAGCSRRDQAASEKPEPSAKVAAAGLEETGALVVYTYDAFPQGLQESVTNYFTKTHRVDVKLIRYEDAGGLFNQLILEKDSPKADVMIGLDSSYLGWILHDDLLTPYEPEGLVLVDEDLRVDPRYRAVPFDFGRITLNYDSEALPEPPTTWDGLLAPSLKEKIVLMNPATSSPGRNFLLYTIAVFGEDGYLDFWRRLKPNLLTVTAGWSQGYALYTQGEAPIVLSYDTSPAYHIQYENETRYKNLIFDERAYAQIEVAGIVRGAANLKNAQRFMDYIVDVEFQTLIPLNQFMYPIHPDVVLPEAFRKVEKAMSIVNLDGERIFENFERWLREWETVMQ